MTSLQPPLTAGQVLAVAVAKVMHLLAACPSSIPEAVDVAWADLPLDDDLVTTLAKKGLAAEVRARKGSINHGEPDDENPFVRHVSCGISVQPAPPPAPVTMHVVLTKAYRGADGTIRPLSTFGKADLAMLEADSRAKARGHLAVAKWCRVASQTLESSRRATLGELSERQLAMLDAAWPD